ncbi:MAG: HAD family hydrolase [Actinomycetota bacterium]|nr:HAD family hydrolase [Actinomycetota bacterium]
MAGGDHAVEAILFDIDGTLITTGGAGAVAWRRAFEELYGVSADINTFTHAGMTDPEVGRLTFAGALGREPERREFARVMARRQHHLADAVAESQGYRVLDGVEDLLPRLVEDGLLLGLTTGNTEVAAHIKLSRANLNRFFSFGGYGSDSTKRVELTQKAIERAELVSGETLEPGECMAVGDTPLDVDAGHGAGISVVGVASGQYSVDQLREAGADYVVASLVDGLRL